MSKEKKRTTTEGVIVVFVTVAVLAAVVLVVLIELRRSRLIPKIPEIVKEKKLDLGGGVMLEMVWIPGGAFEMGSTARGNCAKEAPVHKVTLDGFWMGKYEVTQAQWLAVMGSWPNPAAPVFHSGRADSPSLSNGSSDDHPAYFVSWHDVAGPGGFIETLNAYIASTGQGPATFRLPTEAEWEYACRAGTTTRFYFGDSLSVGDGDEDGPAGALPGNRSDYMWLVPHGSRRVGYKRPNAFGLHDMHGNVAEWCQDWYGPYSAAPQTNPTGPTTGTYRMRRGGWWGAGVGECQSASRHSAIPPRFSAFRADIRDFPVAGRDEPDRRTHSTGFRLARTP